MLEGLMLLKSKILNHFRCQDYTKKISCNPKFYGIAAYSIFKIYVLMKTDALALMGTTSFCAGVRHKRYSVQQEIAPNNATL
jgi:hypothetical protein